MVDIERGISLLFQKPFEPLFVARDDGKAVFDIPAGFYTERFQDAIQLLENRFADDVDVKIPLQDIPAPDLTFASVLTKAETFSVYDEGHRQAANGLIKILMGDIELSVFLSAAAYAKDRVNPGMYQYALSVSIQNRKDTKKINLPSITDAFPGNFVNPLALKEARAEGTIIPITGNRRHIKMPRNFTATAEDEEQRVAYFREDINVNKFHWNWHLTYPADGLLQIVNRDRRGELFYYINQQILARYNFERLYNQLPKTKPLNLREPIAEAYFPKILSCSTNRTYPSRPFGTSLKDIDRNGDTILISDIERFRDRIFKAIDEGFVTESTGNRIPLDGHKGIDILGNMIQGSILSPNCQFYGNINDMCHKIIGYAHDPNGRYLEEFGVIADHTTAMRDPVFYRLQAFLNSIFVKFKNNLPQYIKSQLHFSKVTVNSVEVKLNSQKNIVPNVLLTYWQTSELDLAPGLEYGPNGSVYGSYQHLQHAPFNYKITATNTGNTECKGICRIFLVPIYEIDYMMAFNKVRQSAIEMDKFVVNLQPGANIIMRRSEESSVTRSERQQAQMSSGNPSQDDFCSCGWPQHMLLPKGTTEGTNAILFVMISDYDNDFVPQSIDETSVCKDSSSYCGIRNKLYPDKQAMGYPFDRPHESGTLESFVSKHANMKIQEIQIKYRDTVIDK